MIWFLERNADLLICEIRHSADGPAYEFEIAPSGGQPQTMRFASAKELITEYLRKQSQLQAQGWRPRSAASGHSRNSTAVDTVRAAQ